MDVQAQTMNYAFQGERNVTSMALYTHTNLSCSFLSSACKLWLREEEG